MSSRQLIENEFINVKELIMNNYPFLFHQHLSLTLLAVLSFLIPQKVNAGAIEISIDPYNNSGYDNAPIENNQGSNNDIYTKPNLPSNNQNIDTGTIYYVKGNSTPPPPSIIDGNLATSNQTLPAIPPVSEPYSQQQNAEVNPRNVTPSHNFSVSVSPFDVTPQEDKPINSVSSSVTNTINSNNNNVRTINLNPQNSTPNPPSTNINTDNSPNSATTNFEKRRNLREILVFSNPSNRISSDNNNGNNQPSVSVVAPSTVNNQKVYRVLAQTSNNSQETGVKSLYPEAFKTNYQGKSLLQVGVFSTKERAQQVSQSLTNIGVRAIILN